MYFYNVYKINVYNLYIKRIYIQFHKKRVANATLLISLLSSYKSQENPTIVDMPPLSCSCLL